MIAQKSVQRRKKVVKKKRTLEDADSMQCLVVKNMPEHMQYELLSTMGLRSSSLLANNFEEFSVRFYFSIYASQLAKNPLEK